MAADDRHIARAVVSSRACGPQKPAEVLIRRFGAIPGFIEAKISVAAEVELFRWAERIVDAGALEEVFD